MKIIVLSNVLNSEYHMQFILESHKLTTDVESIYHNCNLTGINLCKEIGIIDLIVTFLCY